MHAIAIRDNMMFTFLNETHGEYGEFKDTAKGGIILSNILEQQRAARWGKVVYAGPEACAKEGQYIFIKPLMWFAGFKFDGKNLWKTENMHVLAVSDELPEYEVV